MLFLWKKSVKCGGITLNLYKIILSPHMKKQKMKTPKIKFETIQQAYKFGIGKYGSGTYQVFYNGELIGWSIETI